MGGTISVESEYTQGTVFTIVVGVYIKNPMLVTASS